MFKDNQNLLNFANQLAWDAGKVTLKYFQTNLNIDLKSDNSPVTNADRETEIFLRDSIKTAYPTHGILGEEFEEKLGNSSYRWILDPIDGTKSFIRGVPLYSVTIALEREGVPILGVINFPAMKDIVYAASGLGCWWNGRRCRVSQTQTLDKSLVLASLAKGYRPDGQQIAYEKLLAVSGMFRTWGDSYGYALVATGRAEVMFDPSIKIWDAAPLLPILQEAEGTFTDWDGNATIYGNTGLATNGQLLQAVLHIMKINNTDS